MQTHPPASGGRQTERGTLKMKKLALILAIVLALPAAALGESSAADEFLGNLSKTWDSFLRMAEDAGQSVSDWATEYGVTEWAEGAVNDLSAWAKSVGLTQWAQDTLSEINGWVDESGLGAWTQETAAEFQAFIEENSPAIEAWLQQAGQEVARAWDTLVNPEGHTRAELEQAYETVTYALSVTGG